MNDSEIKISTALSQHFGRRIEVKEEKDKENFPIFRVNEKLSYFVSNDFSINGIPLGKSQYLYRAERD